MTTYSSNVEFSYAENNLDIVIYILRNIFNANTVIYY